MVCAEAADQAADTPVASCWPESKSREEQTADGQYVFGQCALQATMGFGGDAEATIGSALYATAQQRERAFDMHRPETR